MKIPSFRFPEKLESLKGIFLFFVILTIANIFWKYNVLGDESTGPDSMVTFWGLDISAPFNWMTLHVAQATYAVLHFFGSTVTLVKENKLLYSNGNAVLIIWACTGIKQAYICFCILAFSRGPWDKKVWYIPLCLLVVYLFNIFRIAMIAVSVQNHQDWFDFLHLYFFKYIFYGVIFLMWVFWEEKIIVKENTKTKELA